MTLLVVHPLLRRAWNAFVRPLPSSKFSSESTDGKHVAAASNNGRDAGDARLDQRASFDFLFALVFLAALHGFSALKVLLILAVNYRIGTGRWVKRREWVPLATWIFNICILFANELARGYRFRDMAVLISPGAGGVAADEDSWLVAWGAWLDKHGGLVDRWEILFNITVLRLISFNMDCYWSLAYWSAGGQGSASPVEVCFPRLLIQLHAMKRLYTGRGEPYDRITRHMTSPEQTI